MEQNIEYFNTYTAKIFDYLYSKFPVKDEILSHDFLIEQNKEHDHIFFNTMTFLKDEGYIVYENYTSGWGNRSFSMVRLSAKGLAVLNATPKSLEGKEPFIAKVRDSLKSGTGEATKSVIQEIIRFGISGW